MSSVPPLRDDDLALVAAWPARPDAPIQIAERLAIVLSAITEIKPEVTGWKRARAKAVAQPQDIAVLADMVARGAVKDSQRPPVHMKAAGYLQWFYPVGGRGVQVMILAGQHSDRATSSCVVQIQRNALELRTADSARKLMVATIDAFNPRWAAWIRNPLGDEEQLTADGRSLGYLNYGTMDEMRQLDPRAVEHENGAIAMLGDNPELTNLAPVRAHLPLGGHGV